MKHAKLYYLALALLLTIALLLQPGCGSEPEIAPSKSDRWLQPLGILPENEITLKAAFLQDSAYLDEKKRQYPQTTAEYAIPACTNGVGPTDVTLLAEGDHDATTELAVDVNYSNLVDGADRSVRHEDYSVVSGSKSLWVSIMTPKSVATSAQQTITLSIQAALAD